MPLNKETKPYYATFLETDLQVGYLITFPETIEYFLCVYCGDFTT